jgi:serine/threonine-protein kinase RsbW
MNGRPQISITFPATPAFLRLARLTSADAGSRAGFDYEDIDDLRIAVSELCSLVSGAPSGDITLSFQIEDGVVEVEGHASQGTLVENEFSRMIVDAVVEGLEFQSDGEATTFRCTKRSSTSAWFVGP